MDTSDLLSKTEFVSRRFFEDVQIARFGDRYVKYRSDFKKAMNLEFVTDFPLYIMLEQTFKCNLGCVGCIQGNKNDREKYATETMSDLLFDKIIDESGCHNLCSIAMHSTDEPLLVNRLSKRIELARQAGVMDIILTTNGNLLTRNKSEDILNAGVTHILFSLDAYTVDTYNKVRPGGDFDKVLNAIKYIREIRGNKAIPLLRASFVESSLNKHEKKGFVDFFRDIVDFVEIQAFSAYGNDSKTLAPEDSLFLDPNEYSCSMPFTRVIIRGNGDVLPCCSFYSYDIVLGNINTESIKNIWRGDKMNSLRADCKNRSYSDPTCRLCISSTVDLTG
ncbi:MAG: SPASM domain-containing protein [Magnetococcales bacterium]|nr:SPASM domain-containing protein [Magnetococcales bacterium]MBF0321482.1 SPASM domain-containing protein [Magnetococcales bacterium]